MQINKNRVLKRKNNKPILIDTYYSKAFSNQPIVVFCHGYKGFKDWGAWDIMAKQIASTGCCFVKFNFSHNGGTVDNPIDFPDLEAFGNNNYTKELNDLNDVLDYVETFFNNNKYVNTQNIILIGHSRGGGIAIIKSAEDARIKKLVTLASICDFAKRTTTVGDLELWKKEGVKYVLNARTKQQMPHYYQFYEDFMANKGRLDIKKATKHITIPHLIIHSDADTSINISEAKQLHEWNPQSTLKIIKDADHVFNVKHPWKSGLPSVEFQTVIDSIILFIK